MKKAVPLLDLDQLEFDTEERKSLTFKDRPGKPRVFFLFWGRYLTLSSQRVT